MKKYLTKKYLTAVFLSFMFIFATQQSFANSKKPLANNTQLGSQQGEISCREYDDDDNYPTLSVRFTNSKDADIRLYKHNTVYKVALVGHKKGYDIYENRSSDNSSSGKLVFFFNKQTGYAGYSFLGVSTFGSRLEDSSDDNLMCGGRR